MKKRFHAVERRKIRRSPFNLSHDKKLTMNMGKLYPILNMEVMPSDKIKINTSSLIRLAPMLAPVMHRVNVYVHYWYVPYYILTDNWKKLMEGEEVTLPKKTWTSSPAKGSLYDYLGLPVGQDLTGMETSWLPIYAYNKIYNEFYRDQNLQTEVAETFSGIHKRAWEKDYFTSCLPTAQKGDPVGAPLSVDYKEPATVSDINDVITPDNDELWVDNGEVKLGTDEGVGLRIENIDEAYLNINDLRTANALQRFREALMRSGSRYAEYIRQMFNWNTPDNQLYRPEYLGGSKNQVLISEVLNTSATSNEVQGEMAGHGVSVGQTMVNKSISDYGIVMGIMSVMPKAGYMQGIHKMWSREEREDFPNPMFANLGEQEVLNKEIYANAADVFNEQVFGYQERYAELKFMPNTVHGDFRDDLEYWHLGNNYATRPQLNDEFIECDPSTRIFAVDDSGATDKLWCQVHHDIIAQRPLPYFGTPKL